MKTKRLLSVILVISTTFAFMCVSVSATGSESELPLPRASTDTFYTPVMEAGVEWSGYAEGDIFNMVCSTDSLTGSDIGISFHNTNVGLPLDFVRDNTRHGKVTVKDDDPGDNTNEVLFHRIGDFSLRNGVYRIYTWGTPSNVDTSEVEDNNMIELYILVDIETKLGDSDTTIPARFLGYSFYTTY